MDVAAIYADGGLPGFATWIIARESIFWFRRSLSTSTCGDLLAYLRSLPRFYAESDLLFVHGSPREPTNEYVFPEEIKDIRKMRALFERVDRHCFQGHTHIPGVFTESLRYIAPAECQNVYRLGHEKTMVNVGSVGQPRDDDWRASYVLFDGCDVRFRRLKYDINSTVKKIYENEHLDNMLGDRLRTGR